MVLSGNPRNGGFRVSWPLRLSRPSRVGSSVDAFGPGFRMNRFVTVW
jgi:hypothetical protein